MTEDEFLTWAAFFSLEPRGDERADWHIALWLAQQANMNRPKGAARIAANRFLPHWEYRPRRRMTPEEMRDEARSAFGLGLKADGGGEP